MRELVKSCPLAGKIKIGFSRPDILTSREKKKEVGPTTEEWMEST